MDATGSGLADGRDHQVGDGRYHRQMLLPGWGEAAQARLAASHAVVLGVGALGCVAADQLVRAGVGRVTLVDRDVVELTNLQRQTLFDEADAGVGERAGGRARERGLASGGGGMPKAEAARRRLSAVNSGVVIEAVVADYTPANAESLVDPGGVDVFVDGTDNFETRFLLNDVAVKHGKTYVYGGAVGCRGMVMPVLGAGAPCLRCVFREPPAVGSQPTCDTAGVHGPLVGVIGAIEASVALRVLAGAGGRVEASLTELDLFSGEIRRVDLSGARDAGCPCCGLGEFAFLDGARGFAPASLCGREAVQVSGPGVMGGVAGAVAGGVVGRGGIDLAELASRLAAFGAFEASRFMVRGTLRSEGVDLTVFADGRAIVGGTTDVARARAVYAKYVGS